MFQFDTFFLRSFSVFSNICEKTYEKNANPFDFSKYFQCSWKETKTSNWSEIDKDLFEANQDVDDTNKGVYCHPLWHYWQSERYMYERNQNPLWFLQNVCDTLKTERKSEFDKDLFEANQDVDDTNKGLVYCPNLVATIKFDPLNNLQDGWHH